MSRHRRPSFGPLPATVLSLLVFAGCDLGSEPRREPTTIVVTPAALSFDALQDSKALEVEVLDQNGSPMTDLDVSWSSLDPMVAQVTSAGVVTSTGEGNTSVVAAAGSAARTVAVSVFQLPAKLEVLAGDDQEGVAGDLLPLELRFRLEDRLGQPVEGAEISFTVLSGGGTVSPSPASTDPGGIAETEWRLGQVALTPQVFLVSVVGAAHLSTEIHALARAGAPTSLVKDSGDGQAFVRGGTLPDEIVVRLLDRFGNPVQGTPVSFEVTTGGGSASAASGETREDGRASALWTLGELLGVQTLRASASGLPPVEFSATAFPVPGELRAEAPADQTGTVGQPAPDPPVIRLLDEGGVPIAGAPVTFTVETGNGSVQGPPGAQPEGSAPELSATTDASGFVGLAAWILGTVAGQNTVRASAFGGVSVVFVATGLPGPAEALQRVSGDGQTGPPGEALSVLLAVRVTDSFGNPVPGVPVQFTPDPGSGTVAPASATGQADGLAETTWTLGGTTGQQRVTATAAEASVAFTATASPAPGGGFHIGFELVGGMSAELEIAFADAAARWAQIITEKLPDVTLTVPANSGCGNPEAMTATFDDVYIFGIVQNIDGPGGALAQAGPCFNRDGSGLPVLASVRLDESDLDNLIASGRLDVVVLHEMAHALGFGTRWRALGLLQNPSTQEPGADTHFNGVRAIAAFDVVGGSIYTLGQKVPVENAVGGTGTRDSHWRGSVFVEELMIGFITSSVLPLSRVTAASLADLGYSVNEEAADPYTLPGAGAYEGGLEGVTPLGDDVLRVPVTVVDGRGRTVRVIEPADPVSNPFQSP